MPNLLSKELLTKTPKELATLVFNLKLKLLESRFASANGALEKPHTVSQIKKTIATIQTALKNKGFKVSVSTHGVDLIDIENKKIISINEDVKTSLSNFGTSQTKKNTKNNEIKQEIFNNEKPDSTIIKENSVSTKNKVTIRKSVGG